MKILHSADLHLDSPITGRSEEITQYLRQQLLQLPEKIAQLCKKQNCDLLLLSGDIFDGACSPESVRALKLALEEAAVPTFIAPGNHDFCGPNSPWLTEIWPKNVHIFTHPVIESISLPELDCRIYGAGFTSMDCGALLENFRAQGSERFHIAVLHGDPTQSQSPYCPITQAQVTDSALDYLALGHIHKGGAFRAGSTLCAWPGCPMGRGFDEVGEKGVLLVSLEHSAAAEFIPLDTPRFQDITTEILTNPTDTVASVLPAAGNRDFYRITLTGEWDGLDVPRLAAQFPQFPHLEIRNHTVPATDLWGCIGDDSLEGVYFRMLHDAMECQDAETRNALKLAAKISRKLLDGQEVTLP